MGESPFGFRIQDIDFTLLYLIPSPVLERTLPWQKSGSEDLELNSIRVI
jgi:hypothetical protein